MTTVLSYNSRGEEVRLLQKGLNERLQVSMKADGVFGKLTEQSLREFQQMENISETGVYDEATQEVLAPYIESRFLMPGDIDAEAKRIDVPVSMLKAIRYVEGKADGFLPDGRPLILFERHKFYSYLVRNQGQAKADQVMRADPNICNSARGGYHGNEREFDRLDKAIAFDSTGALNSASWGMFQIMGFNYQAAGYGSVQDYVTAAENSESDHLFAVCNFIDAQPALVQALRNKDFNATARIYNGSGAVDVYGPLLRDAELKFR